MTRSRLSAIVLAALAATTAPQPAASQGFSQGYPPGFSDQILYITKPHLEALFRGMDAELAMRAELKKEIASYGTPQQYEACTSNAAMSPEGQKIMAAMTDVPANATAEEAQRHMAKMAAEMEALVKRACPLNPSYWNDVTKRERLEEMRRKASEIAFGAPAAASVSPNGLEPGGLLFEALPEDPAAAEPDTIVDPKDAKKLSVYWYNIMVERIVKYCDYMTERPTGANAQMLSIDGLKIPGEGENVYWVFTPKECILLVNFDCRAFLKKYAELI